MEIRELDCDRGKICERLLRLLPEWFGIEEALRQYTINVERMPALAAYAHDQPVGMVALKIHNESTAEIYVMAIDPTYHRRGIGRQLIDSTQAYLKKRGFEYLTVKTLSAARENSHYAITRNFYSVMGFKPVEEFKTIWGKTNPCLMMLKVI